MNILLKIRLLLVAGLASGWAFGQPVLRMDEAVRIALENNFQVQILRNNETIAANSNTYGNAGYLPRVSTTGTVSYSSNNTNQKFFSGDTRTGVGAGNTSARGALEATWTAFDGFRMFATKERLETLESRSHIVTEQEMHGIATDVQLAYYELVRIQQQISITKSSIELNQSLRDLASGRLRLGAGTELEVLQATNAVNADSSALLTREDQLDQAKMAFNLLLGREAGIAFSVPEVIEPVALPALDALTQQAMDRNYQLSLLNMDERLAALSIKEAKADLYPRLNLNLGYTFSYSRAEVGFLLSNRTFGPTGGVTLTYDLFTGRNLKKDIANANLFQENIKLSRQDITLNIRSTMAQLFQQYQGLLQVRELELKNVETATRNTELARQLYQAGRATDYAVREAILQETQVRDRLSDYSFRMKMAELHMKSLAGMPMFGE
ncbi:MAG: TolC family protein [Saprospiraceae bacterium]|nr:TolC family protein [Saprospiraceae bacterium]